MQNEIIWYTRKIFRDTRVDSDGDPDVHLSYSGSSIHVDEISRPDSESG